MFAIPDAKRIRRSDLYSTGSSPSSSEPDSDTSALFHAQLANLYGPADDAAALPSNITKITDVHTDKSIADPSPPTHHETATATAFEFRLFSTSTTATAPPISAPTSTSSAAPPPSLPQILLDNDDDASHDAAYVRRSGAFTVPYRNRAYYFNGPATGEAKHRFEDAAVRGEDVRAWIAVRYSGWEVPWRVRRVRIRGAAPNASAIDALASGIANGVAAEVCDDMTGDVDGDGGGQGQKRKKGKPGKKRRIILRMRKRKVEEGRERRARVEKEREEQEREKRTRRNREKKVKRKVREKMKKGAGLGPGSTGIVDGEAEDRGAV